MLGWQVPDDDGRIGFGQLHRLRGGSVCVCGWDVDLHVVCDGPVSDHDRRVGVDELHRMPNGQLFVCHGRERGLPGMRSGSVRSDDGLDSVH